MVTEELFTALDWVEHTTMWLRVTADRFDLSGGWSGEGTLQGAPGAWTSSTANARSGAGVPVTLAVDASDSALKFRASQRAFSIAGTFTSVDCAVLTSKCKALGQVLAPNDCD